LRPLAALAVALTVSSPAFAEGMPQLDFKSPLTISQVVWLAIIFFTLYLLLARWALPQVAEVLEARAATIRRDLDAARLAKVDADGTVAELTRAARDAQASAQGSIASAVNAAKAEAATRSAALNAKLDAQLHQAEERIGAARAGAVGALRQVATETAGVVIARLTGQPANDDAVTREVGVVLAARGQA